VAHTLPAPARRRWRRARGRQRRRRGQQGRVLLLLLPPARRNLRTNAPARGVSGGRQRRRRGQTNPGLGREARGRVPPLGTQPLSTIENETESSLNPRSNGHTVGRAVGEKVGGGYRDSRRGWLRGGVGGWRSVGGGASRLDFHETRGKSVVRQLPYPPLEPLEPLAPAPRARTHCSTRAQGGGRGARGAGQGVPHPCGASQRARPFSLPEAGPRQTREAPAGCPLGWAAPRGCGAATCGRGATGGGRSAVA
jgi:hypothetical protein